MANDLESIRIRKLLLQSLNSKVEVVTNFGSITGKVTQTQFFNVPLDYIVLKESDEDFVYIPLFSIISLILIQEEGVF
ncbi:hypothetical protein [Priestia megaterium]|uniref:hypothetical protein n=1 Tax=Priestia megaterium TaxID=1404 RepID=UPI000D516CE0|nr:hypothetical protein [Priestia megaterium]PVE74494.1 hypothetical protein DC428_00875 [Priestia megaterium]PVE82429.1 hypothetical protein DC421_20065 [Priestia megaterium]PVE87015.1 hypothetical protein DC426_17070 [Priestia megaterium]PVE94546.1 hypothetical protein DC433_24215 [Priestia megaterium]